MGRPVRPTKKNEELEQHPKEKNVDSTSGLNNKSKCEICAKSFFNTGNLNMHMKTVHLNYVFKCHICKDKTFSHKENLRKHLVKVHRQDPKEVATLTKKIKPFKAKNSEDQDQHNNPISTNEMAVRNTNSDAIVETIGTTEKDAVPNPMVEDNGSPKVSNHVDNPAKNYNCESCIQSFTSQTELAVHIIAVHVKNSLNLQH